MLETNIRTHMVSSVTLEKLTASCIAIETLSEAYRSLRGDKTVQAQMFSVDSGTDFREDNPFHRLHSLSIYLLFRLIPASLPLLSTRLISHNLFTIDSTTPIDSTPTYFMILLPPYLFVTFLPSSNLLSLSFQLDSFQTNEIRGAQHEPKIK